MVTKRSLDKHVALPSVNLINNGLANKLISTNLGKNNSPDKPVDTSSSNDGESDNTVNPVRERLVDVLAILRGGKGGKYEVDVAEHEEDDDGHAGGHGRVPVPLGTVDVKVEETGRHKGVDNGERVGDKVENEVVSITRRRCEDDNDTDQPMLKETGKRSVERSVAGPEAGKGEDTLTTKLLNETTLRENDTENIAKSRKSDKDGQGTLGSAAKDVAEERGSDETLGSEDLVSGDGGKVGNVDEHVEDRDGDDGNRGGNLESADGVLCLAEGVVGVGVADKTPDDVVQGSDDTVGASSGSLKGVGQVVGLLVNLEVTTESNETTKDDDQDDDDLDNTEEVLKSDTPFESETMDEEGDGDASHTDTTLVPSIDLYVGGVEDVFSKDDRVTGSPTEEDDVSGVETSDEELGLSIDVFKVVLFTTILGDSSSKLEVDGSTSSGNDGTDEPHDESETGATAELEDGGGSGKDTGTDDTVKDEHGGGEDTNLTFGIAGLLETTMLSIRLWVTIPSDGLGTGRGLDVVKAHGDDIDV